MFVFDKDVLIKHKLMEYDKQSLKTFASDLGLSKLSQLNKSQLADLISEKLTDPEVMFYRMSILDDAMLGFFEKVLDGPCFFTEDDIEYAAILNELEVAVLSKHEIVIPKDIVATWKQVDTPEFHQYRKKASWVWKCVNWAEEMYGITPIEIMLQVINAKSGMDMTGLEFDEMFFNFPVDQTFSLNFSSHIVGMEYLSNKEKLDYIKRMQADKEYYIPTVAEVEELYEEMALISSKAYKDMHKFLIREASMDPEEAKYLLCDLWRALSIEADWHGVMQEFADNIVFDSEDAIRKFAPLYMALSNDTRMLINRGHKPSELHKSGKPDLDKKIKIFPNAPCPCGSGKKYKKCCGK